MILVTLAALAEGAHTGVPTAGIEGFSAPMYQTSQTGWSAQVEHGLVRVFVGHSAEEAKTWLADMTERLAKLDPQPYPEFADEALGDGERLLLFREGNIGVLVHTSEQALLWAERTLAHIDDTPHPWPAPPALHRDDLGWWRLEAPGAAHIAYVGGERVPGSAGLVFSVPPRAGVAWDGWGRASRVEYSAAGLPLTAATQPPPRTAGE